MSMDVVVTSQSSQTCDDTARCTRAKAAITRLPTMTSKDIAYVLFGLVP
jgi:hypothetical protein